MKTIEFIGLPRAGKLTLIRRLIQELSLLGYKAQSIQLDRSIPAGFIQRNKYFDRQMLVLTSTISDIIIAQDSSRANVIFVHRGPWDAWAFFEGLIKSGRISKKEAKPGIALSKANLGRIELVVLVKVSVQVSLDRNLGLEFPDLANDRRFLETLFQVYQKLENELPKRKSLVIDGVQPIKENLEILLEAILPFLKTEPIDSSGSNFLCPDRKEGKQWRLSFNV